MPFLLEQRPMSMHNIFHLSMTRIELSEKTQLILVLCLPKLEDVMWVVDFFFFFNEGKQFSQYQLEIPYQGISLLKS